ncbi:hypothetical protein SAMN04488122_3440 [Chitinophaga arvensicola]|uniref:Uncharacterized protein n=1 Tax=Chitinophaga arvensicola TaxID=29529 RepID=A0A1I0RUY1_9BACT|nr:hypothetical protein SAMN04488122_3440 [Chitinophaga arvensicola]
MLNIDRAIGIIYRGNYYYKVLIFSYLKCVLDIVATI